MFCVLVAGIAVHCVARIDFLFVLIFQICKVRPFRNKTIQSLEFLFRPNDQLFNYLLFFLTLLGATQVQNKFCEGFDFREVVFLLLLLLFATTQETALIGVAIVCRIWGIIGRASVGEENWGEELVSVRLEPVLLRVIGEFISDSPLNQFYQVETEVFNDGVVIQKFEVHFRVDNLLLLGLVIISDSQFRRVHLATVLSSVWLLRLELLFRGYLYILLLLVQIKEL